MHRSILMRVAIVAAAALALGACGQTPAASTGAATSTATSSAVTVPGTSVALADAAAFASTACGLKAPTDALLTGVAAAAYPPAELAVLGVEGVGNLLCSYRAAVVAATPAATPAPATPTPAPTVPAAPPAAIVPTTPPSS
jgi:hypothetical protein